LIHTGCIIEIERVLHPMRPICIAGPPDAASPRARVGSGASADARSAQTRPLRRSWNVTMFQLMSERRRTGTSADDRNTLTLQTANERWFSRRLELRDVPSAPAPHEQQ
jgi:hypothetical protein